MFFLWLVLIAGWAQGYEPEGVSKKAVDFSAAFDSTAEAVNLARMDRLDPGMGEDTRARSGTTPTQAPPTTSTECSRDFHDGSCCNWKCYLKRYRDLQTKFGSNDAKLKEHYDTEGRMAKRFCSCPKTPSCNWGCYLTRYGNEQPWKGWIANTRKTTDPWSWKKATDEAMIHYQNEGILKGQDCTCVDCHSGNSVEGDPCGIRDASPAKCEGVYGRENTPCTLKSGSTAECIDKQCRYFAAVEQNAQCTNSVCALDRVLVNITVTPVFYEDTLIAMFRPTLATAIAMSTGTTLKGDNVKILAITPNTKLKRSEWMKWGSEKAKSYPGEYEKFKNDMNATRPVFPKPTIQIMAELDVKQTGESVMQIARLMKRKLADGELVREVEMKLANLGFAFSIAYPFPLPIPPRCSGVYGPNKTKCTMLPSSAQIKHDSKCSDTSCFMHNATKQPLTKLVALGLSPQDEYLYPRIHNVSSKNCFTTKLAADVLDQQHGGEMDWKNFSKTATRNISLPGPFTSPMTSAVKDLSLVDFKNGRFRISLDIEHKAGATPAGTLMSLGGNGTCFGITVYVDRSRVGVRRQCSKGLQYEVSVGNATKYNLRVTYKFGKVKIYKDSVLFGQGNMNLPMPQVGMVTIGSSHHNSSKRVFTFGSISNVDIKGEVVNWRPNYVAPGKAVRCTALPCGYGKGWLPTKNMFDIGYTNAHLNSHTCRRSDPDKCLFNNVTNSTGHWNGTNCTNPNSTVIGNASNATGAMQRDATAARERTTAEDALGLTELLELEEDGDEFSE